MTDATDTHAEEALKQLLPRFPKRWHKQLHRLGMDSFSSFVAGKNEEPIYTIKSGNTVLMARCLWCTRPVEPNGCLLCSLEVIHTRGSSAVSLNEPV